MRSYAGGLTEGAERTEFTNGATEQTETKRRRRVCSRLLGRGAGCKPAWNDERCGGRKPVRLPSGLAPTAALVIRRATRGRDPLCAANRPGLSVSSPLTPFLRL